MSNTISKQNTGFIILITAAASLGGLLFGYDTGVINGTQFYFSKFFGLSDAAKGFAVGSALIGCFFGAAASGMLSNAIGRKSCLILSALLFTLSAWGSGLPSFLPQELWMLVVFRIIGGIGVGIASMNAPTYIAEIAPANKRGVLVTYYQLAIVIGFFVVFLATYFIGQNLSEAEKLSTGWRNMFWSELIPCFLFLGLMFVAPKSPRWLATKGRFEEAKTVLRKIYIDESDVENEISEIKSSLDAEKGGVKMSIFAKGALAIVVIGTILSALQQFTGINAVLYYGADIFESALGFGEDDVLLQQILLAGVNFLFTFVAMFTVDKFGRKPLLIIGGIGMLAGFLLMGIVLKTSHYPNIKTSISLTDTEKILLKEGKLGDYKLTVTDWFVEEGDYVKEGQVIANLQFNEIKETVLANASGEIGSLTELNKGIVKGETVISKINTDVNGTSSSAITPSYKIAKTSKGYQISSTQGLLCLLGVLLFIGAFAMSMGPIVWVMLSEMFPNNIRSVAMSIAVAAQWAANYVVSQSFPMVVGSNVNKVAAEGGIWNQSLPYFIFSAFIAFIIYFVIKYIPETKGKSLEDVEQMWEKKYNVKF